MEKFRVLGEFFFSQIQGKPIHDHQGRLVGKLRDLAIRWEGDTPRVTGIKYARGIAETYPGGPAGPHQRQPYQPAARTG